jgi:guanine deaminase
MYAAHTALLRQAIELAVESVAQGGGPFGALVARNGRVVGRGRNEVVSSADPTAHAEILAIRDACRRLGTHDLAGCELYASCEPCPMCRGAIQWARLSAVHYAATSEDAAEAGFDDARFLAEMADAAARARTIDPALRAEARAAFRTWAARSDRTHY